MTAQPIPAAKVRALREALERGGSVTFKNGSVVELDQHEIRKVGEESPSVVPFLEVIRPANGRAKYDFDDDGLRRAYAMALYGPPPKEQPSGVGTMFGDDPPF